MKKIFQVVGARPNFMKVAPVHQALRKYEGVRSYIVHTGQHSDINMSEVFFTQLGLDSPDFFLGVQPGTATRMTAFIMEAFEKVLEAERPDLVVVVGDVNSTLACALTSVRNGISVAHVEAGLRSRDRSMPEEINRILTDQISDLLFTTEASALENLIMEGIDASKIFFSGNCMIDSLIRCLPVAGPSFWESCKGQYGPEYALMTMHRPSNVDSRDGLQRMLELIRQVVQRIPLVFPVHPRTKDRLQAFGLWQDLLSIEKLIVTGPMSYLEFISCMRSCRVLLTDSGGVQEETTYLNIPCLTFRATTERPVTVSLGSNILIEDFDIQRAGTLVDEILNGNLKSGQIPPLWDGKTGERIALKLMEYLGFQGLRV